MMRGRLVEGAETCAGLRQIATPTFPGVVRSCKDVIPDGTNTREEAEKACSKVCIKPVIGLDYGCTVGDKKDGVFKCEKWDGDRNCGYTCPKLFV